MDIRKLLELGQTAQNAEHAEAEVLKRGNLRGGSAGCIDDDGVIHGECHRKALARLKGVDKGHPSNRYIMFNAGNAVEDSWAAKLKAAGAVFRREDECPVVWQIPGTERIVTGRPDILIGVEGETFTPTFGIELKGVFSHSTAVSVELERRPVTKHVVQAGFYSMALGSLPYALCYTSASVIEVAYWAQKKFGKIKKLQPFYRFFYLSWDNGRLRYRDESSDEWVTTKFTAQGIADYYRFIVQMEEKEGLGPRPTAEFADGTPAPWDACGYCEFQPVCDTFEHDYKQWFEQIKLIEPEEAT